ncbi:hypothetical protein CDG79_31355 [Nostoc sp. 'Peltigera membranacea cyanobiont' 232]|nr:hypothetical protein CDG79_31355 [Nostoc sp. 'Peltigera membranacea cyanobiont' 232]
MKRDSNWVMDFQKINYPIYSDYIFLTPPAPLLMQRLVIFSLEVPYEVIVSDTLHKHKNKDRD